MSETGEHPVTTDWLTEALRAGEVLPHGSVEAVDVGVLFCRLGRRHKPLLAPAYMMAVHWYPERRHRLEDALLRHYHQALVDAGVRGYGLEALRLDYRPAVVRQLSVPVFQHSAKLPAAIWWSHLERIFLAFDDLGCEELLAR